MTYKKIVALLLGATLMFSSFAFASEKNDYTNEAKILSELGLLKGTGGDFELGRAPTRAEGAVMLVRMLGKEEYTLARDFKHPFTDVPQWADKHVGYMYQFHLTKGVSEDKFGSNDLMNGNSYATLLLRALGYDDKHGDFSWNNALDFSKEKNIITDLEFKTMTSEFTRNEMVGYSKKMLNAKYKFDDMKPIEKLVNEDLVDVKKAKMFFVLKDENIKDALAEEERKSKLPGDVAASDEKEEVEADVDKNEEVEVKKEGPKVKSVITPLTDVNASIGKEVYLPNQVTVRMDDGTDKNFKILWNQEQLNGSKYENYFRGVEEGSFKVDGKLYLHEYQSVSINVNVFPKIEFSNPALKKYVARKLYNKNIDDVTHDDLAKYTIIDMVSSDYNLTNLKDINLFQNLETLNLRGDNSSIDFTELKNATNLKKLDIQKIGQNNLKQLFDINSLDYLKVSADKDLSDFNGVEKLSNLKELVIRDYIKDTSALDAISSRVNIKWMNKSYADASKVNDEKNAYDVRTATRDELVSKATKIAREAVDNVINPSMTDEEKAKAIQNYIVTNVKYDTVNFNNNTVTPESHTIYGALLDGLAVCDGFSSTFHEMATYAGLETKIMRGSVFVSNPYADPNRHSWNYVKINGNYYHIDTSSDSLRNFSDPIRYTYYMKTNSEIKETHNWHDSNYPELVE